MCGVLLEAQTRHFVRFKEIGTEMFQSEEF
jgi:hypothetical protein